MAFFDDSLIAQLIHSFGVRIQKGKVSREHGSLVGEMLLKGYHGLPASGRHRGFDLWNRRLPTPFCFFFSPLHPNLIYTNQIKIDTGQRID